MNLRVRVVNARRKIVSSEMVGRTRQQFDDETPRGSDPASFGAQRVERPRYLLAHPTPLFAHDLLDARVLQLRGVRIWSERWIEKLECS